MFGIRSSDTSFNISAIIERIESVSYEIFWIFNIKTHSSMLFGDILTQYHKTITKY